MTRVVVDVVGQAVTTTTAGAKQNTNRNLAAFVEQLRPNVGLCMG